MLRENLLLSAIQSEETAFWASKRMGIAGSLIGPAPLTPESRKQTLKEINNELKCLEMIRMLDHDGADEFRYKNSPLAIQAVYEILQRVGIIPE